MTASGRLTPRTQASLTGGTSSTPLTPSMSRGPAGLSAESRREPWYVTEILDAEARAWIAAVDRRCNQAAIILIFFAALWFITPCIGSERPQTNPLIPSEVEGP